MSSIQERAFDIRIIIADELKYLSQLVMDGSIDIVDVPKRLDDMQARIQSFLADLPADLSA